MLCLSAPSETREDELAKAHKGHVVIGEVQKQIKSMNSRHAAGLEVLEKEHATMVNKLKLQAKEARRNVEHRSKNFNSLVEQTNKEIKAKERRRSTQSAGSFRL
jgi:Skp family chaperone for outer membrane proteins